MATFRENLLLHYHLIRWTTALVVVFSVYSSVYYAIVGYPHRPQSLRTAAQVERSDDSLHQMSVFTPVVRASRIQRPLYDGVAQAKTRDGLYERFDWLVLTRKKSVRFGSSVDGQCLILSGTQDDGYSIFPLSFFYSDDGLKYSKSGWSIGPTTVKIVGKKQTGMPSPAPDFSFLKAGVSLQKVRQVLGVPAIISLSGTWLQRADEGGCERQVFRLKTRTETYYFSDSPRVVLSFDGAGIFTKRIE
jgi:hypothetical protein